MGAPDARAVSLVPIGFVAGGRVEPVDDDWGDVEAVPWMAEFGPRGELRQPPWASELMRGYW